MPMVGGKKFPYTAKGKEDSKKAAKKAGLKRVLEKKKKNFSGVKTQTY
jgi:hypothetical protein